MADQFIIFAGIVSAGLLVSFGFFQWLEKIELEKEYLQSLLKEQRDKENIIRK